MYKIIGAACCLAALAAGCGGSNRPTTSDDADAFRLTQVGELCRHFQFANKKPPQRVDDLARLRSMGGNGYEALQSGDIVLMCNATLPDLDEDSGHSESQEILAYQKDVPQSGGYVLLLNRSVRKMTTDEFKAASKPAGATAGNPASAKMK
jgi:hypothetical protein